MTETDPLLAALIAKLPAGGSLWPAKKRVAWLELMTRAFDVVYEGDGDTVELPPFIERPVAAAPAATPAPAAPVSRALPVYPFYIDHDGRALRGDGAPVMPGQVLDQIFDLRGESGDLGSIVWADGSRGVLGITLDIVAA
jgi:hypothetical protein